MTEIPDSVKQSRNFREMFGALTVEDWWAHSELLTERAKQLTHWSPEHDDAHSPAEWVVLLAQHVGDMADLALWSEGNRARFPDWIDTMKGHALHVGALAWAYVASLDRAILDASERELVAQAAEQPAEQGARDE